MIRTTSCRLSAALAVLAISLPVLADSPLPRDPNNVYGQFENGLSYIIRQNHNPPKRVGLYLHVKTGSLNEADTRNGIAHFIEHMAFNGSAHFKPGELVPYLNKLGMEFGHHTNAHTSYDETVFNLFMPDVQEQTVDQAMTILADFAYGLLLSPEEIQKEQNVILEEARAQKSAAERIHKELMRKVFEGTRIAVHDVIGDEKQIPQWQKPDFEDYVNTWYRPEAMTLIVVGEIEPEKIVALAKKHLGEFKARTPAKKPQGTGIKPVDKARAFVLTDPEQVMGQVQLLAIKPGRPPMKTYNDYRFNELENLGTSIVSRRLKEMVEKGTGSFRDASAFVSSMYHDAILPMGRAAGEPQDWSKMLQQVVVEINRAVEHGFTEREMKLTKDEFLADAEKDVERESTLDARRLLGRLNAAMAEDEPILSAQQRLDLLKKILQEASAEDVHKVFVDNFKTGAYYSYVLIMPEKKEGFTPPAADEVLAAAADGWAKKTEPPKEEKVADSILPSQPEPGKVEKQTVDEDLKITTAAFANGVTLHHRYMDYKKEQVLVRITIPGGEIEETKDNHGVSQVGGLVFDQPATSRLDSTQIRDLMTGKKAEVNGNIGLDALTISINASPKDLEYGLQLVHALLTDGRIEQSAFDNWKKATLQRIEMLKTMPQGQLMRALEQVFFAGDVRLAMLTAEEVGKLDVKAGQEWLKHIAGSGGMEVAVVGDISLEDCLGLAAKYLGSLPKRQSNTLRLDTLRKLKRGPGPYAKNTKFESVTPKAMVLAGFVSCNDRDVLDRRLLALVARVLSDRMIQRIREEERLVYGIGCENQPAEAVPGMGLMYAAAPTDPENGEKLAEMILNMMKEFAKDGPTDEELQTAKKQIANTLDTSMKEPSFWAQTLDDLEYRGKPLAEIKELPGVYQTYTAKQLQDVVKKYMKDETIVRLVVIPETKAATTQKQEEAATRPAAGAAKGKTEKPQPAVEEEKRPDKSAPPTGKEDKGVKPASPDPGKK
jgi:zinc protease